MSQAAPAQQRRERTELPPLAGRDHEAPLAGNRFGKVGVCVCQRGHIPAPPPNPPGGFSRAGDCALRLSAHPGLPLGLASM